MNSLSFVFLVFAVLLPAMVNSIPVLVFFRSTHPSTSFDVLFNRGVGDVISNNQLTEKSVNTRRRRNPLPISAPSTSDGAFILTSISDNEDILYPVSGIQDPGQAGDDSFSRHGDEISPTNGHGHERGFLASIYGGGRTYLTGTFNRGAGLTRGTVVTGLESADGVVSDRVLATVAESDPSGASADLPSTGHALYFAAESGVNDGTKFAGKLFGGSLRRLTPIVREGDGYTDFVIESTRRVISPKQA